MINLPWTQKLVLRSVPAGIALLAAVTGAVAQVETASTTPTRIYTTPGGAFSFAVNYTGPEVAITDLAVTYTANTASPLLTPSTSCISAATPAPFASANPDEFYVLWEPASGTFPASCGGTPAAAALAAFSGVAKTIPGGKYVIQVINNAGAGALNDPRNDFAVCQKVTVNSITAPAPAPEGTPQTFIVNFTPAVAFGCEGFAIPVALSGAGTAAPDSAVIGTNTCSTVAPATTLCSVTIASKDNGVVNGDQAITLSVLDSAAASNYISSGKSASSIIRDNDSGAPLSVSVFEFYNTGLKHYFRTAEIAEAVAIDAGAAGPGWVRTGFDFTGYVTGSASPGNDVCRFYNPVANTHFYTADPDECAQVRLPNSGWRYEGISFRIRLPVAGSCASGTIPVYRSYNNRFAFNDSNHRFTTSLAVYSDMKAQGWVGEGIVMCALASG